MKNTLTLLLVPFFTGCLLEQKAPNPPKTPIQGAISIEDLSGAEKAAILVGTFGQKSSKILAHSRLEGVAKREPACQVEHQEKSNKVVDLLSVGKMGFGTALQTSLTEVPENKSHEYELGLPSGLPSNTYQVVAAGTETVGKFTAFIQVPELLTGGQVNEQDFSEHPLLIQKGYPIVVRWKPNVIPHAAQRILFILNAESADKEFSLSCVDYEDAFPIIGGNIEWTLSEDLLVDLPAPARGKAFLIRGLVGQEEGEHISVTTFGLRTLASYVDIVGE